MQNKDYNDNKKITKELAIKNLIDICKDYAEVNYLWDVSSKIITLRVTINYKAYHITIKRKPAGYIIKLNWVGNFPFPNSEGEPVKLKQMILHKVISFEDDWELWYKVDGLFQEIKKMHELYKLCEAEQREKDVMDWIQVKSEKIKNKEANDSRRIS